MKGTSLALSIAGSLLCFGYGLAVGIYEWFPFEQLRSFKKEISSESAGVKFSSVGARDDVLEFFSGKTEVDCPVNTERLGVFVTLGQSNSANTSSYKVTEDEVRDVINFHAGNCYRASSPLLGATGIEGEWMSLTAQYLVDAGLYDKIVIMSLGIADSPIVVWTEGNELNDRLVESLRLLSERYDITDMLWHQGESDLKWGISENQYLTSFSNIVSTIRRVDVTSPIFISITSFCKGGNYPNNITNAQLDATKKLDGIILGVNTDKLITSSMRYDNCHFNKEGQRVAAQESARLIVNFHTTH